MALKKDTQFLNVKNIEQLVNKIKDYHDFKDALLKADVIKDASLDAQEKVNKEAERAALVEGNLNLIDEAIANSDIYRNNQSLVGAINAEVSRAKTTEKKIAQDALDNLNNFIKQDYKTDKEDLQNLIHLEEDARIDAINTIKNDYKEKISTLKSNLETSIFDTKINLQTIISNNSSSINARITKEVESLNNDIANHNSEYTALNGIVQFHISDEKNPHNVTTSQIGAATKPEHDALESRVTKAEATIVAHEKRIGAEEGKIDDLQSRTLILESTTIKTSGEQTIDGALHITGNLAVDGTTTTVEHETLSIKDHQFILNSDGDELGGAHSGIAIRKNSTDAYGIVYDPTNDSVSLGLGTIINNSEFAFIEGENKPILTRDISDKIEDGHLLSFDKNENKAVDSGYSKNVFNNLSISINNLNNLIGSKDKLEIISEKSNVVDALEVLDGRLDSAETTISDILDKKQNKEDDQLTTANKSIVPAINEIRNSFIHHEVEDRNPHNVTWEQIYNPNGDLPNGGGGPVFASPGAYLKPAIGEHGYVGASTTVARHDHQHPIDTSRAPVDHSSIDTIYGEASTSKYGHVKIANSVSNGNVDIATSGTVYTFVTNKIYSLDYPEVELDNGETIKNISQTDGIIKVEKQSISITQDQVQELPGKLTSIDDSIKKINKDVFGSEDGSSTGGDGDSLSSRVTKNTQDISKEYERASQAEAKLQEDLSKEAQTRKNADDSLGESIATLSEMATNLGVKQSKIDGFRDSYSNLISNLSDTTLDSTYYTFKFEKKEGKYLPVFISSWDEGVLE